MHAPLYQVDAFTDALFGGNPAAVVPLDAPLDAGAMQRVARENNLSETAFLVPHGDSWDLRWFTPTVEVDLCGHATLASAFALRHAGLVPRDAREVRFHTRSGELVARYEADRIVLDLPAAPPEPAEPPEGLASALGAEVREFARHRYAVARLAGEATVRDLRPDMAYLASLDAPLVVTAEGEAVDFVSRFFGPTVGVPEDPVTGSAHCLLAPFWAERLRRTSFRARQLSARGGALDCALEGDRVRLAGHAVLYLEGTARLA